MRIHSTPHPSVRFAAVAESIPDPKRVAAGLNAFRRDVLFLLGNGSKPQIQGTVTTLGNPTDLHFVAQENTNTPLPMKIMERRMPGSPTQRMAQPSDFGLVTYFDGTTHYMSLNTAFNGLYQLVTTGQTPHNDKGPTRQVRQMMRSYRQIFQQLLASGQTPERFNMRFFALGNAKTGERLTTALPKPNESTCQIMRQVDGKPKDTLACIEEPDGRMSINVCPILQPGKPVHKVYDHPELFAAFIRLYRKLTQQDTLS